MKSRHTPIRGKLTRSFGIVDGEDMVVELNADGHVVFRREPADRKLKRGEQLPELQLEVEEMCRTLGTSKGAKDALEIIKAIASRIPIAKFEGDNPKNLAYAMKVWLMQEFKRETEP